MFGMFRGLLGTAYSVKLNFVRPAAAANAPIFQVAKAVYEPFFAALVGVHDAEQVNPQP